MNAGAVTRSNGTSKKEMVILGWMIGGFLLAFYLPVGAARFDRAVLEGLELTQWYAREHVLLCLIPALFIAGGVSTFINQAAVMRYLGPKAAKPLAYGVASVSGTIMAVCSCTVLPLFAGIWRSGAGLGPATAFLYSGPAINVLAIVLTARILGTPLGLGRAVGAVLFCVLVGLLMHWIFRREEQEKAEAAMALPEPEVQRPLWQNVAFFVTMVGVLVFANWGKPEEMSGFAAAVFAWKWPMTGGFALALALVLGSCFGFSWRGLSTAVVSIAVLIAVFPTMPLIHFAAGSTALVLLCVRHPDEGKEWVKATWALSKQILPLLVVGVFIAGLLLGRPGHEGLIPSEWVSQSVGDNSMTSNVFASVVGAFMYFATLTEVPILQGLLGSGMAQGPALALLLAGPALSLPNMLVLRSVMGGRKTAVYVMLVVIMATFSGWIFGTLWD